MELNVKNVSEAAAAAGEGVRQVPSAVHRESLRRRNAEIRGLAANLAAEGGPALVMEFEGAAASTECSHVRGGNWHYQASPPPPLPPPPRPTVSHPPCGCGGPSHAGCAYCAHAVQRPSHSYPTSTSAYLSFLPKWNS